MALRGTKKCYKCPVLSKVASEEYHVCAFLFVVVVDAVVVVIVVGGGGGGVSF